MYGGVFDGSGLLGGGPLRFNRAARADTSPNTSTNACPDACPDP
jgi:hypothetical protein